MDADIANTKSSTIAFDNGKKFFQPQMISAILNVDMEQTQAYGDSKHRLRESLDSGVLKLGS